MGIFNFKDFIIEKLGVSESSLVFGDFLESRVYHTFLEFLIKYIYFLFVF